jgi:acyl-CoA reductase-like NAD-dependent aldehyde dehydrogenase
MAVANIPVPIAESIRASRQAQVNWAAYTIVRRLAPVRAFRHLLVELCDQLCDVARREINKSREECISNELLPLADACRFLEKNAAKILRPRRIAWGQRPWWLVRQVDTVYRRPRGIVGIIGTWNYPFFLNGVQIVQSLAAGNAVIWKPSEVTPECANLLTSLLGKAGFPGQIVQVLPATREAGPALLEGDLNHLVFTGGEGTGRIIAAALGGRLISSTLELSGCDSQFVLADAELSLSIPAAWFGVTLNGGQTCIAVRRSFVHRSLYGEFCSGLERLGKSAPALPLAQPGQVEQAERLVAQALAGGAKLLVGSTAGEKSPPSWRPAIVADATPDMAICREASFASLMAVIPFDDPGEAIAMARSCPFGLSSSVFTRDIQAALALADQIPAGSVCINDVIAPTAHPATPFGGRGSSGWGVTQGAEGLFELTVPQVVSVRKGRDRLHYQLAPGPGQGTQEGLLRGFFEMSHAATLGGKWRGWRRLWRAIRGKSV